MDLTQFFDRASSRCLDNLVAECQPLKSGRLLLGLCHPDLKGEDYDHGILCTIGLDSLCSIVF